MAGHLSLVAPVLLLLSVIYVPVGVLTTADVQTALAGQGERARSQNVHPEPPDKSDFSGFTSFLGLLRGGDQTRKALCVLKALHKREVAAGLTLACPVPRSHHAGAAELRHLPLRQLPPVPAGLPPRPLLPVVSQERLHHQHCRVRLRGEGAGQAETGRWRPGQTCGIRGRRVGEAGGGPGRAVLPESG